MKKKNSPIVGGQRSNDQLQHITGTAKAKPKPAFPEMDPKIWSRLPKELLEQILSFLPLKTLLNLRSTCKHFKSLVFSPPFISKHSSASSPLSSFLLLYHPLCFHHFPLYDSVLSTWRNFLPLSDLLPRKPPSFSLLSTSNGLFCFSLPCSSSFLVRNLLAGTSRLVDFPVYPFDFEAFTLVCSPVGYKLFAIRTGFSSTSAFVYDSNALLWRKYDGLDPILIDNHQQEGACYNGCLYFTTPEPFSIVCFDLESGRWERSDTELPGELTFVRLVTGEGKLYMIGGVGADGISRSLKLWQLTEAGNWVEVERLPEMMCRKFVSVCYHNYEHVYCFWHQGRICVCCYTWPEILYYKVSRRTWHWLPKCPHLPDEWSCGIKWFSFVPELYAPV
ncbi:F-box/kelch-repeat protein At5g43190 [Corylus avellana]|uniref:F-box/kelch-repeat protein At5g43190 n=1 Tax=Corylus avellana TaxID=13451 RepID=UPI00286D1013|nr:F-box/kelch-repeat protein At5g43190 [Corylus avellana]